VGLKSARRRQGIGEKRKKDTILDGTNRRSPLPSTKVSKKQTQKGLEITRKMPYEEQKKAKKQVLNQPA
jgi:hypothetical protein